MPEPRSMVSRDPPDFVGRSGQPQNAPAVNGNFDPATDNLGRPIVNIPFRLRSGAGIAAEYGSFDVQLRLDIEPLQIATGQPNQQWLACWVEGDPVDVIRRVPVNAIPQDAPHDGILYGRLDGHWEDVSSSVSIAWDDVRDKPATFPPTLPIASSGITGLDQKQGEQDTRLTSIEGVNTTQGAQITLNTNNISANNAAITANATAITTKVSKAGDTMTGPLVLPGDPASALQAATKAYVDTKAGAAFPEAPNDGKAYTRKSLAWAADPLQADAPNDGSQYARQSAAWTKVTGGAIVSDTAPATPLDNGFWWQSTTGAFFIRYNDGNSAQWVQLNNQGIADAPKDSKSYARKDGTWFDISATFATQAQLANYLPLTGGTLTGGVSLSAGGLVVSAGRIQATSPAGAASGTYSVTGQATGAGGGVIGFNAAGNAYGILGLGAASFTGQGTLANTGSAYFYGILTTNSNIVCGGHCYPATDNSGNCYLGLSSNRWYAVYSINGTIQTSDEREKTDIRSLDEKEKAAAQAIKGLISAYRWKNREQDQRLYIGVIAQRIEEALNEAGLDAADYAMWTKEELTSWVDDERDDDGNVTVPGHLEPTGEYRYSVDYSQVLAFIIGGL